MTAPRVVTSVEELAELPRWTVFEDSEEIVWVVAGDGWFHSFRGCSYRASRVPLPALVLTPSTVQWEYGAFGHVRQQVDGITDVLEDVKLGRSQRWAEDDWTPDVLVRRAKAGEWVEVEK